MKNILTALLLIGTIFTLQAQLSPGFRAGINLSRFGGPTDMGATVNGDETVSNLTGFHIAGSLRYPIYEDMLSTQVELVFNQRGTQYNYNGIASRNYTSQSGIEATITGDMRYSLNVTNSYIDIPLTVNFRPVEWIEFIGGINAGFLVNSTGSGSYTLNGTTQTGALAPEFAINLDHNYKKDDLGETKGGDADVATFTISGFPFELPTTHGAYYSYQEDYGNKYNTFDFGVIGGAAFYINQSLFVSGRLYYGLTDITNNEADHSLVELKTNGEGTASDDTDRNVSIQMSIGFGF